MKIIPVVDTPSQNLRVTVGGQNCTINLYQKTTGFYFDLSINDTLIVPAVICRNLNKLVRYAYHGVVGDFFFQDTQGNDDPTTPGLGTRFLFCYLEASDV